MPRKKRRTRTSSCAGPGGGGSIKLELNYLTIAAAMADRMCHCSTNAAWLRLQVITYNLLQLLKKVAPGKEYAEAHPRRLRFTIFTTMGKIVKHIRVSLKIKIGRRLR